MEIPSFSIVVTVLFILSVISISAISEPILSDFVQCLAKQSSSSPIPANVLNQQNTIFQDALLAYTRNKRFSTPATPKPWAIVPAAHESHVQATVICAKQHRFQLRIRSGGHDFEALSYVSNVPFVILDLFNLRSINVNVKDESAWVESGATIGEIYTRIAEKSNVHGFPAAACPGVGAGGHFSGGGYGNLMRKCGLAADNIVDAKIVDVNGAILDRQSMGEDLFWAIRGGATGSFGVILSWKIKLVRVPKKVTVFNVKKTLEQNATDVIYKWQFVAPELPPEIFIRAMPQVKKTTKGTNTVEVSFVGLFLGRSPKLIPLLTKRFPELGLQSKDSIEMSWINSTVFWADFPLGTPTSVLLNRLKKAPEMFFKNKSDYVKEPIPKAAIETMWQMQLKIGKMAMQWNPYGGRMSEISESATPFPHRAGNLFMIHYVTVWANETDTEKYIDLLRKFYEAMTPFVSKDPREAYQNYRDLDIGASLDNQTSFQAAWVYGKKYFKNNFDILVNRATHITQVAMHSTISTEATASQQISKARSSESSTRHVTPANSNTHWVL